MLVFVVTAFILACVFAAVGSGSKHRFWLFAAAVCALAALSRLLYGSGLVRWAYVDVFWCDMAITAVFLMVLIAFVFGLLLQWIHWDERREWKLKAPQAGMTVQEFGEWQQATYERLIDFVRQRYGRFYEDIFKELYEQEEQKLFASRKK